MTEKGKPNLKLRKPTNARTCECGKTIFAYTSLCWIGIVDVEDGWLLRDYKWSARGQDLGRPFYAKSKRYHQDAGSSWDLHRAVMSNSHSQYDHRNGNGHDCRRSNLRPCTEAENGRNKKG